MDRMAFENVLNDEFGRGLTEVLIKCDFDTPVSFMIGETSEEILRKIQQTFSRRICRKIICNDQCISCSLYPSTYAKLAWFVQRLLIMSPLSKPFIKQTTLSNQDLIYIKDKNVKINATISCDVNQDKKNLTQVSFSRSFYRNIYFIFYSKNSKDDGSDNLPWAIAVFIILFIMCFLGLIFH
jgi:hypothetical protein